MIEEIYLPDRHRESLNETGDKVKVLIIDKINEIVKAVNEQERRNNNEDTYRAEQLERE